MSRFHDLGLVVVIVADDEPIFPHADVARVLGGTWAVLGGPQGHPGYSGVLRPVLGGTRAVLGWYSRVLGGTREYSGEH